MALNAGSVTVDSDGNATGSGLALDLYNADPDPTYLDPDTPGTGWDAGTWKTMIVAARQRFAAKYTAQAAVLVAAVGAADVRVAVGAIDSGIPSTERVLSGAVE